MRPHPRSLALVGLLAVLLSGCARYPMGLTKSEWEALTPGQQARYRRMEASDNQAFKNDSKAYQQMVDDRVKDIERRNPGPSPNWSGP